MSSDRGLASHSPEPGNRALLQGAKAQTRIP